MNRVPRVAAIHDMSGIGRCSLTVIIPVLSSMGAQVCPVPTAILSAHSGGWGQFAFQDLTATLPEYAAHWKSLGLQFDCIYSGFLGSAQQIDIVSAFFDDFGQEPGESGQIIVVDPVMGDHGRLYKTYTPEMQAGMRALACKADLITPNLTETCFLLDKPYSDEALDPERARSLLKELCDQGPESAVITGVKISDGKHANVGYSRKDGAFWRSDFDRIPVHYPGTGDVYTSVLIGARLSGDTLPAAMQRAGRFVRTAVSATHQAGTPEREGVLLERVLGALREPLGPHEYAHL